VLDADPVASLAPCDLDRGTQHGLDVAAALRRQRVPGLVVVDAQALEGRDRGMVAHAHDAQQQVLAADRLLRLPPRALDREPQLRRRPRAAAPGHQRPEATVRGLAGDPQGTGDRGQRLPVGQRACDVLALEDVDLLPQFAHKSQRLVGRLRGARPLGEPADELS